MASSTRRLVRLVFLVVVWGLLSCAVARAVAGGGGTGEPNDPYQIVTAEQLLTIGSSLIMLPNAFGKHYVLMNSIDMSGRTLARPVFMTFMGILDGKGHTIRNLRVQGDSGLFHNISRQAEVRNLGLVDAQITGTASPAILAGSNSGRVVNCYSTGTVGGKGVFAGGLVGVNTGTVTDSYSTAQVTGGGTVGGLVGQNIGVISSCYATGAVTGSTGVGGLAGTNAGEIVSSHYFGIVTVQTTWAGGLAGSNGGRIISSYAEATVVAQSSLVGGLTGQNRGLIRDSYATGRVTGLDQVGGLVGSNEGQITASYADVAVVGYGRRAGGVTGENRRGVWSCYSAGSVETGDEAGGLVGNNNGTILTSYSVAGVLSYGPYAGGLVGRSATNPAGVVRDSFLLDPRDGGGPDNGIGVPLTSAEMKLQASFTSWDFWGTAEDGVSDVWFMPAKNYPVLAWQTGTTGLRMVPEVAGLSLAEARAALTAAGFAAGSVNSDFHRTIPAGHVICAAPYPLAAAGATISLVISSGGTYDWSKNPGKGTAVNPYQIQTAGQLESLIDHPELWNRYFALSADVDMAGRTYSAALIAPDMDNDKAGFQGTAFSGTFDGQGHAIRRLAIRSDIYHDYLGLFGMIAQGAKIDSLHLPDVDLAGGRGTSTYIGALAGHNAGTITGCSATGIIDGGRGDGLVGENSGSLIDCQADVTRI